MSGQEHYQEGKRHGRSEGLGSAARMLRAKATDLFQVGKDTEAKRLRDLAVRVNPLPDFTWVDAIPLLLLLAVVFFCFRRPGSKDSDHCP